MCGRYKGTFQQTHMCVCRNICVMTRSDESLAICFCVVSEAMRAWLKTPFVRVHGDHIIESHCCTIATGDGEEARPRRRNPRRLEDHTAAHRRRAFGCLPRWRRRQRCGRRKGGEERASRSFEGEPKHSVHGVVPVDVFLIEEKNMGWPTIRPSVRLAIVADKSPPRYHVNTYS